METYSMTDDIELLDARLEELKDEGKAAAARLESLQKLKDLAHEENVSEVMIDVANRMAETLKRYELLKEHYRLVREKRDSLPV